MNRFVRILPTLAQIVGARARGARGARGAGGAGAVVNAVGAAGAGAVAGAGAMIAGGVIARAGAFASVVVLSLVYKIIRAKKLKFEAFGFKFAIKGSVIIMVDETFDEEGFKNALLSELNAALGKDELGGFEVSAITLEYLKETPLEMLELTSAATGKEDTSRDEREAKILISAFESIDQNKKIDLRRCKARVISMITSYTLLHAKYDVTDLQICYDDFKYAKPLARKRKLKEMRYSGVVALFEEVDRLEFDIWSS